jgi:hypothetical protein
MKTGIQQTAYSDLKRDRNVMKQQIPSFLILKISQGDF